jgi:hypothetical protein
VKSVLGLTVLVLASAGCRGPVEPRAVSNPPLEFSSPTEVVLKIGQEARVDALLRLDFLGVPEDSRCPAVVECFWAGDAAVAIAVSLGMGPSFPDTLHTTLDPKAVLFGGYTITLVELTPYPQVPGPIPPADYAARFKVERIPLLAKPSQGRPAPR